jgi:hypothetical protein
MINKNFEFQFIYIVPVILVTFGWHAPIPHLFAKVKTETLGVYQAGKT